LNLSTYCTLEEDIEYNNKTKGGQLTLKKMSSPNNNKKSSNKLQPFISGGVAAMTGAAASHPLDVIRVSNNY
jgi:hypothetical protein